MCVTLPRSDHAALVLELRGVRPPPPHAPCAASSARDRRFNDRSQRSVVAMFAAGRRKPKPDAAGGPVVREPCISDPDLAPGRACQGEPAGAGSGTPRSPSEPARGRGSGAAAVPDLAEPAGSHRVGQHGLHEAPLSAGETAGAGSSGALPVPSRTESAGGQQGGLGPTAGAGGAGASAEHSVAAAGGTAAGAPGAERTNGAALAPQETSMPRPQQCCTASAAGNASQEELGSQRRPEPTGGGGTGVGGSGGSAKAGARERKRPAGLWAKADPKPSPAKKRAASGGGAAEAAGQRSIRSFFGGAGADSGAKQG